MKIFLQIAKCLKLKVTSILYLLSIHKVNIFLIYTNNLFQITLLVLLLTSTLAKKDETKDPENKNQKRSLLLGLGLLAHRLEHHGWGKGHKKEENHLDVGEAKVELGGEDHFGIGSFDFGGGHEIGSVGHHGLEVKEGEIKCPVFQCK